MGGGGRKPPQQDTGAQIQQRGIVTVPRVVTRSAELEEMRLGAMAVRLKTHETLDPHYGSRQKKYIYIYRDLFVL